MVSVGSSPGGGRSASNLVWIIPPSVVALAAAVSVVLVADPARMAVGWCGAAATAAVALAAGEAARRGRVIAVLRRQRIDLEAGLRHRLALQEAETLRLAKHVLPAAIDRLHAGAVPEEVLSRIALSPELDPSFRAAHHQMLESVLEAVSAEEGLRDAAQRAFVNIARRVQAIVHQQAMDLRQMEDKHGNEPAFFNDLLHIDHGNALVGRLADSIAVLGGSRPGRQWRHTIPLYNVLRGAMSRILEYRRVSLHSVADVGIVGPTVEPLIHAVAELLDNATRYSPPQTKVHLTAVEVQSGVAVEIEDAGVGLVGEAKTRANRTLAQALSGTGIDLDDLGETPRLGLSVVGRLAKDNEFGITMRPSAYGGVRAVVVVPQSAVTVSPVPGGDIARAEVLPPPKPRRLPGMATADLPAQVNGSGITSAAAEIRALASPFADEEVDPDVPRNANGLPQRRRRMPQVPTRRPGGPGPGAAPQSAPVPPPRTAATRTATSTTAAAADPEDGGANQDVQPGIWLAAFTNAVNGEEDSDHPEGAKGPEPWRARTDEPDEPSDDKDE